MRAALYRSLVFVPGNNTRFLEKAQNIDADIVCLDLEDSVGASDKAEARALVRSALASRHRARVFVRTNAPGSKEIRADIEAVMRRGLDGLVVPKVDTPAHVRSVSRIMARLERSRRLGRLEIIPSIESASGVASCSGIASSSPRVSAVVFGVFDLLHDMRIEGADAAAGELARSLVPLYARAGGAAAIDSIWQDLRSRAGLVRDCRRGRSLGYAGKSVIHPDQIAAVHRAFAPTRAEAAWAEKVKATYEESVRRRRGALRLEGRMIDEVHYKQACALLDALGRPAGGAATKRARA